MTLRKAAIVGAGIGGIASAIRLVRKGYKVNVFDKNSGPGGKLSEFKLENYRFDFGPSLFTMPEYVIELFQLAGKDHKDYFEYLSLEEACRYFFSDGSKFIAPTDAEKFSSVASKHFRVNKESIDNYFSYNRKIFEQSGKIFLNNSMHKLKTFMSAEALKSVTNTYVIELFRTMNLANKKAFNNEQLVQLFNRYATYNGSSPYQAPAILNSISVLEHLYGTYFPKGGMFSITNALYRLAQEMGVKFHFNEMVEEIILKNKVVKGVKTSTNMHESEIVVSNMDVSLTYEQLLPQVKQASFYSKMKKSSSAVIFYWGIKKVFREIGLHNIFFSADYKKEFEHIFHKRAVFNDPTVYINNSSVYNDQDAPEGCANWFVMINVPHAEGIDWTNYVQKLRKYVLNVLSKHLEEDIESLIEVERMVNPLIIEQETLSQHGALYGSNSNKWTSAFLRHPNFSSKLKGLYFVGGSVHPGGGIPLCLLSAKIASSLIK